jgi:hypothetical protein
MDVLPNIVDASPPCSAIPRELLDAAGLLSARKLARADPSAR